MRAAALAAACAALCTGPAAGDSIFGCRSSTCRKDCANCPYTSSGTSTCPSGKIDCGDPTAGTAQDQAWATGCFQYDKTDFDSDGCEFEWTKAEWFCGLFFCALSLLFCITWPFFRCCNCCGGHTVNSDSFCTGQPGTACCGDSPTESEHPLEETERRSAGKYFEHSCSVFNPCHPTGARVVLPGFAAILIGIAVIVIMTGGSRMRDALDDTWDGARVAIDEVLTNPANEIKKNLETSKDCQITVASSRTYRDEGVNYDSVTNGIDDVVRDAKKEIDDAEDDSKKMRKNAFIAAAVLAFVPLAAVLLVVIMACVGCSKVSKGGGASCLLYGYGLAALCPLIILTWLVCAGVGAGHILAKEFCDELDELKQSPPRVDGTLATNVLYAVCDVDDLSTRRKEMTDERNRAAQQAGGVSVTIAPCPAFDNATDILLGNPRILPRGGMYEGMANCRRIFNVLGRALDNSCNSLQEGLTGALAGTALSAIALSFAFFALWLGYKRWVTEAETEGNEPYYDREMEPSPPMEPGEKDSPGGGDAEL
eukprot:TRINITY_DN60855_c0_g1_i1.p1 TRINITY_DN60855_c0_g1~~TRINITY_DN60855_c0_g1_i1.p1  ORF type:complete len:538 (+),score=163.71 TRINITY_DN60855_c0_g1_i1:82-1695(+)